MNKSIEKYLNNRIKEFNNIYDNFDEKSKLDNYITGFIDCLWINGIITSEEYTSDVIIPFIHKQSIKPVI